MPSRKLERRLSDIAQRLKAMRAEAAIAEEQLAHFSAEADDARLRAIVSETPLAASEARSTQRHADAMRSVHEEMLRSIAALEREQDEVLDQMSAALQ